MFCKPLAAAALAGVFAVSPMAAHAVSVSFERVTSNASADASSQIQLDVTDGGAGALFDFGVITGANPAPSLAEIYFSDLASIFVSPLTQADIITQVGTNYTAGVANPGNLPGANNASPPFNVTPGLLADPLRANSNALQVGDDLVIRLNYMVGSGFADALAALVDGSLRVGVHVRSLLGGQSDSFVSAPPSVSEVPLPATLPLLFAALGGFAYVARKKKA